MSLRGGAAQGTIYSDEQLQSMLEWCLERHVHMISDEVRDAQGAGALLGAPGLHALYGIYGLRYSLGDAFQGFILRSGSRKACRLLLSALKFSVYR